MGGRVVVVVGAIVERASAVEADVQRLGECVACCVRPFQCVAEAQSLPKPWERSDLCNSE